VFNRVFISNPEAKDLLLNKFLSRVDQRRQAGGSQTPTKSSPAPPSPAPAPRAKKAPKKPATKKSQTTSYDAMLKKNIKIDPVQAPPSVAVAETVVSQRASTQPTPPRRSPRTSLLIPETEVSGEFDLSVLSIRTDRPCHTQNHQFRRLPQPRSVERPWCRTHHREVCYIILASPNTTDFYF
jgi:hypothetical protein